MQTQKTTWPSLGLKTEGSRFQKLDRFAQWLAGNYFPEDFQDLPDTESHEAWVDRVNRREIFIDRTLSEEGNSIWANSTENEPHPLEAIKADARILQNLERSRAWVNDALNGNSALDRQNRQSTAGARSAIAISPSEINQQPDTAAGGDANTTNQPAGGSITIRTTDGKPFAIPTEWAVYMAEVLKKINSLEESMRQLTLRRLPPPRSNSTRLDDADGQHRQVNFQETFTYHPLVEPAETSTAPPPSHHVPRRRCSAVPCGGGGGGGGGGGDLGID